MISSDPEPTAGLREDLQSLADGAEQWLGATTLPRAYRRIAEALVTGLRKAAGYPQARAALDEAEHNAGQLTEFVSRLKAALTERLKSRSLIEPFGDAWRDKAAMDVAAAGNEAAQTWLRRYAEAFAAGQFGTCVWLSTNISLRSDLALNRRMLLSAQAAQDGNLAASLPALETLTGSAVAGSLRPEQRFLLWCMRVRAVARGLRDPAQGSDLARGALAQAEASAPALPAEVTSALHTALGECLLACDDADGAAEEARRALSLAPAEAAGLVLRGKIAEHVNDFTTADEWYEDAVDTGGARAVAGDLFAPVPPNLLWKYGRRIRDADPEAAVRAIQRALTSGIRGADQYPERKAYVDLARALELRSRTEPGTTSTVPAAAGGETPARIDRETANAYWQAGRRYSWADDQATAETYLSKACSLDPGDGRYAFELSETLRWRAIGEDGTVDQMTLGRATESWDRGYELRVPGADISWAYLTMALIAHARSGNLYRPQRSWRAVAVLERGLLADPRNPRMMAQLSQAHRLLGHRWSAFELSRAAYEAAPDDDAVLDHHFLALRELGRDEAALDLIDQRKRAEDQPWLVDRKVQALIARRRFDEAIEALGAAPPGDQRVHDLQLGLCHELIGDTEAARDLYEQACGQEEAAIPEGRDDVSAWACYLAERYDEAERVYSTLTQHDPDGSYHCDFGQVLLARGDPSRDDVRQGIQLFVDGVEATTSMVALRFLEQVELPRLRKRVSGRPDDAGTTKAVEELSAALTARLEVLGRAGSTVAELRHPVAAQDQDTQQAVLLGLARVELAGGEDEQALDGYVTLAPHIPEARQGVVRAGQRMRAAAAELARSGDLADALTGYGRLLARLEQMADPPADLTAAAHLDAALAALQLGVRTEFADHLRLAFASGQPGSALPSLGETVSELHDRPAWYWKVLDAARDLRDGAAGDGSADAAARLLEMLSPTLLLRAGRDDIGAAQLFPLVTPLTIRLGAALLTAERQASPDLLVLLKQTRKQVQRSTGVRIPRIDVQSAPPGAEAGQYEIELYEARLAGGRAPAGEWFVVDRPAEDSPDRGAPAVGAVAGPVDPLTGRPGHWSASPPGPGSGPDVSWTAEQFVVRHLEAVIRTHLPRLFSIDDVGLWLSSASKGSAASPARPDIDRLSRADRLEVLRLLRLLIREQVPILDRDEIFAVVQAAEPGWSALGLLPAVRHQLRSCLAPPVVLASPPVLLPEELEAAVAAGLSAPDRLSWELPRADVPPLAERIVAWYAANASGGPVVVRDRALRPFFWRLLAALVPGPAWVLSQEEIYDSH